MSREITLTADEMAAQEWPSQAVESLVEELKADIPPGEFPDVYLRKRDNLDGTFTFIADLVPPAE